MILQKQLLSAGNLNNAFLSKTATGEQMLNSNLKLNGVLTLKTGGSLVSDNFNPAYMQIDPQGSHVIIFDGANNQKLSVYSSDGGKATYITTLATENYGLIDILGADHLEINTNSFKLTKFGGNIEVYGSNTVTRSNGRQIISNQWADMSANSSGQALFGSNSYTDYNGTFRYSATHASLGARGIRFSSGGGVELFDTGSVATVADGAFTPTWRKLYHAGNGGVGGIVDASTLHGAVPDISRTPSTIVKRDIGGGVNAEKFIYGGVDMAQTRLSSKNKLEYSRWEFDGVTAIKTWRAVADNDYLGLTAGSSQIYTVASPDYVPELYDGMRVSFKTHLANSAGASLKIGSISAVPLYGSDGTAIKANKMVSQGIYTFVYNLTVGAFFLQGEGGDGKQVAYITKSQSLNNGSNTVTFTGLTFTPSQVILFVNYTIKGDTQSFEESLAQGGMVLRKGSIMEVPTSTIYISSERNFYTEYAANGATSITGATWGATTTLTVSKTQNNAQQSSGTRIFEYTASVQAALFIE